MMPFPGIPHGPGHGPNGLNQVFVQKLPSGRLGVGGKKKVTSVDTAAAGSSVARRRGCAARMVSGKSGSSTGANPSLIFLTFSSSMSIPRTSNPRAASVAAMHAPSFPSPQTEILLIGFVCTLVIGCERSGCDAGFRVTTKFPMEGSLHFLRHRRRELGQIAG